ncbi:MAG TPA: transporter [Frateuria sp.]|uniref:transporter n=1 Tax=Frateuria sp. TaxID=2211372 RepID=UPI002D80D839|nr:transporter [Frateuria sp.]HET6804178.1 transporter [Frateuria sp.]
MGIDRQTAARPGRRLRVLGGILAWLAAGAALAQDGTARQSRDDAWWTGPMLANSAETLPRGHVLVEPYVYDVQTRGNDGFGSRAYVLYGLTDDLTVGAIPIIGYNGLDHGPNSSGIGAGDQILQAQYRLTRYHEGSWFPTLAIMLQEAVPTGRYKRLARAADGMGAGAWATTLGLNAQSYFWMPSGRILRVRFSATWTFAHHADIDGASSYGTGPDFHGRATPGDAFYVAGAFEYSLTRRWVLALDLTYSRSDATRVIGVDDPLGLPATPVRASSGRSEAFGFAPAVEYNVNANVGVLLGVRVIAGGHNVTRSVTPAIAINIVH